MGLSVGDFTSKVTNGGSLKLQQTENGGSTVESFATNFKGKVAAFFRGLFKPGTVATENRNVLNAFVTALRSDPQYGDTFADMAANTLARDIRSGKTLTARKVQTVMDQIEAAKTDNRRFTSVRAHTVSEIDGPQPGCFGRMFADTASKHGYSVLLTDHDTTALSREIRQAVMREGQSGMGIVTDERAQEIAQDKIDGFFMRKNYHGAQALVDRFMGTGSKGSEVTSETMDMLRDAAKKLGLPTSDMSKYDFGKLADKISATIMTACESGKHQVTPERAKKMVQDLVNKFMDAKAQMFKNVDETLDPSEAEVMKKVLISNPGNLSDVNYIKSVAKMRTKMLEMLQMLAKTDPDSVAVYKAFKVVRDTILEEATKVLKGDVGEPELKALLSDGMKFAMGTGFTDKSQWSKVVAGLGSSGSKDFKGAMELALNDPDVLGKHNSSAKCYWQIQLLTARVAEVMEENLGLDHSVMEDIMVPTDFVRGSAIPSQLREAMEGDGLFLPA